LAIGEKDYSLSSHLGTNVYVSVDVDYYLVDGKQLGKVYVEIVLCTDSLAKSKLSMSHPDSHSVISC
jgi:hypothetical protein